MKREVSPIPRRASLAQVYEEPTRVLVTQVAPQATRRHKQGSFMLYFGIGMFLMLCLYVVASTTLIPGYTGLYNQWHYGDARVSHLRAEVYTGKGMSDIYAMDAQGIATVIIITDGRVQAYGVALRADVVIISLIDVNSDGKTDLVVHDEQMQQSVVLYNQGDSFSSMPPKH